MLEVPIEQLVGRRLGSWMARPALGNRGLPAPREGEGRAGGFERIGDRTVACTQLDESGRITRLTTVWDGTQLHADTLSTLVVAATTP
jgi:hypothetical protein